MFSTTENIPLRNTYEVVFNLFTSFGNNVWFGYRQGLNALKANKNIGIIFKCYYKIDNKKNIHIYRVWVKRVIYDEAAESATSNIGVYVKKLKLNVLS